MNKVKMTTGIALAVAAAGMVGCAGSGGSSASVAPQVHCFGVNKCGGHNDCKSADNKCKGHASCKGKGFVSMSEAACDHIGGKVG